MENRFKFRVWNGERMLYPVNFGSDAYGSQGQITIGWTNQPYIALGSIGQNPYEAWEGCILMQCTGLVDIDGNLVYEGDIVEHIHNGKISEVFWASSKNDYDFDGWLCETFTPFDGAIRIIGNKYENKK